jgi:hypothetical protein
VLRRIRDVLKCADMALSCPKGPVISPVSSLLVTVIGSRTLDVKTTSRSRWARCSQMAAQYVSDVFPASLTHSSHGDDPICIIVGGHARSHGTRQKVGRAWFC